MVPRMTEPTEPREYFTGLADFVVATLVEPDGTGPRVMAFCSRLVREAERAMAEGDKAMVVVYLDAHMRVHDAWQAQALMLDSLDDALGRGRHVERREVDPDAEGITFHEGEPPPPPDDAGPLPSAP
jgi:hypothetical protein